MNLSNRSLLTAIIATPLFAGQADAALVNSSAVPLAAWDFYGHTTGGGVQSGDVTHTDGLQMIGHNGSWGALNSNSNETSSTNNGATFRWNVGGAVSTWAWTGATSPANYVRNDYGYVNPAGNRYTGPVPWQIEGLTPGAQYDVILYGTDRNPDNSTALFSINGYNSGNPVALDAEGDGNFAGVTANGSGIISGFFDAPNGAVEARITGVQIGEIPEPGTISLLAMGGFLLARRRRA